MCLPAHEISKCMHALYPYNILWNESIRHENMVCMCPTQLFFQSVIVSNTIFKTVLETKCTEPLEIYCMFRLQHFGQLVTNLLWDDSHVLGTKKHSFWSKWLSYLAEILTSQWQEKLQWKRKILLAMEPEY